MTTIQNITSGGSHSKRFVVLNERRQELGIISKIRNTRTEMHPWQAFHGIGFVSAYVGSFYGAGGQDRARKAVEMADQGVSYADIRKQLNAA